MIGFVRDMLRTLRTSCREHSVLLSRQLDEPLPRGVAAGLRIHILYCTGCRRFRAQIRRLQGLAERLGQEHDSGAAMPGEVRDRVGRGAIRRIDSKS